MNCQEWHVKLYQILDHDLEEPVWLELEAHMKICRTCWDRYEFEKELKARIKTSCREESCAESLRKRIKAIFEKY